MRRKSLCGTKQKINATPALIEELAPQKPLRHQAKNKRQPAFFA
ncbi:MAG: hypothetical protein ABIH27_05675 [Candidatus Omnitrophota bacterium]